MTIRASISLGALTVAAAATLLVAGAAPAMAATPPGNPIYNGYVHLVTNHRGLVGQDTNVAGGWTVPDFNCLDSFFTGHLYSTAAIWVGLGGVSEGHFQSTPLVQVGMLAECGTVHLYTEAVYEVVLSNQSVPVPLPPGHPVSQSDQMFGAVQYLGNNEYALGLQDVTKGWSWHDDLTVHENKHRLPTSAEWIVESPPGLPTGIALTPFGPVTFTTCFYQTGLRNNVKSYALTNSDHRFVAGSPPETTVSPVTSNAEHTVGSFTVTWQDFN
jgi:hypothetical protein